MIASRTTANWNQTSKGTTQRVGFFIEAEGKATNQHTAAVAKKSHGLNASSYQGLNTGGRKSKILREPSQMEGEATAEQQ